MGIKIKDIFKAVKIGTSIGSVVLPGGVGKVLDVVTKSIDEKDTSTSLADALKEMAAINDQQTEAILALHERVKKLEAKA